jgi:DNA/RNA-binding domain of Phe-tRNA-synthetase-like protein
MQLRIEPHPLLDAAAFVTTFPAPLGELQRNLAALLRLDAPTPLTSDDGVRAAIRDLLRHGGYKPTGRGKPASEYLLKAAGDATLGTINAAVDACNVVSLHSGLPISVVDLARTESQELHVAVAPAGASYVFNASGQTIDASGLLCLCDAAGPCANAVKDSQRTKTTPHTTETLSVVWGSNRLADLTTRATEWYVKLLTQLGGSVRLL